MLIKSITCWKSRKFQKVKALRHTFCTQNSRIFKLQIISHRDSFRKETLKWTNKRMRQTALIK